MSEANTSDEICNLKETIMKRMILIFSVVLLSLASAVYADPNFTATSQQGLGCDNGLLLHRWVRWCSTTAEWLQAVSMSKAAIRIITAGVPSVSTSELSKMH